MIPRTVLRVTKNLRTKPGLKQIHTRSVLLGTQNMRMKGSRSHHSVGAIGLLDGIVPEGTPCFPMIRFIPYHFAASDERLIEPGFVSVFQDLVCFSLMKMVTVPLSGE